MKNTFKNSELKLVIATYHEINGEPTYKILVSQFERMGFKVRQEKGILYGEK